MVFNDFVILRLLIKALESTVWWFNLDFKVVICQNQNLVPSCCYVFGLCFVVLGHWFG